MSGVGLCDDVGTKSIYSGLVEGNIAVVHPVLSGVFYCVLLCSLQCRLGLLAGDFIPSSYLLSLNSHPNAWN